MKRILVGLDDSPRAHLVLAAAAQLAALTRARLVLFHAVGVVPDPARAGVSADVPLEQRLLAEARAKLVALAKDVPADTIEAIEVALATPWDGIYRIAKDLEADLIVVGSHGYRVLDRILGSTATKVVNHADRNVLIVKTTL